MTVLAISHAYQACLNHLWFEFGHVGLAFCNNKNDKCTKLFVKFISLPALIMIYRVSIRWINKWLH